eukprot:59411-Rhodomonas_salina.1
MEMFEQRVQRFLAVNYSLTGDDVKLWAQWLQMTVIEWYVGTDKPHEIAPTHVTNSATVCETTDIVLE